MGTVYLVGAGPGDPDLLTVRAARLLRRADIVVHDALISPAILTTIRPGAERIDAGKRAGRARLTQPEIHRILIAAAKRARIVVRLKGGDPFIFGRGGEEAEALRAAGVRYEVVPGITAALGAAATAAIPLTHRAHSSAVTFITAHEAEDGDGPDWRALAAMNGTLAVYMGRQRLEHVCGRLIAHGRPPDTPAALIEWATCPDQRVITGSLATLPRAARAAQLTGPALLLIGPVVALRKRLAWFERKQRRRCVSA